jgi:hypothetical protein
MATATKTKRSPGLSPQQEAFCQAVVVSTTLYEAYIKAYPHAAEWQKNSVYPRASSLASNPKIQARVEALRQRDAKPAVVTVRWVLDELASTYHEARRRGALSPAAKCLELAGRSLGMFVDRLRVESGEVEAARLRIRQFAAESGIILSMEDEDAAVADAVSMAIGSARAAHVTPS